MLKRLYRPMLPPFVAPAVPGAGRSARARSCSPALPPRGSGQEFLPNFQETDFLMHLVEKPGTSLEAMDRITIAGQQGAAGRFPACGTSARTSAGPRSPTKSSGRTSPSCGSASTRTPTTTATVKQDRGGRGRLSRPVPRRADVPAGADQGSAHRARAPRIVVRLFGPDLDVLRDQGEGSRDGDGTVSRA